MTQPFTDLVQAWQRDPNEQTTLTLCAALTGSGDPKLITEVGKYAAMRHASSPEVLMAIGRMYLQESLLGDAQGLLVAAGKLAPKNGGVYRLLGEVLLRRGDAARADKVLERAMLLGAGDDAALWRDRARGYLEMQKEAGERAVASEVARVLQEASFPLRSMFDSETTTVRKLQTLAADPPQLSPPTPDRGLPASPPERGRLSVPPPTRTPPPPPMFSSAPPPPLPNPKSPGGRPPGGRTISGMPAPSVAPRIASPAPLPPPPAVRASGLPSFAFGDDNGVSHDASPADLRLWQEPAGRAAPTESMGVPRPREVLDALAIAGVFERTAGVAGWDAPAKARVRFSWPLLVLMTVLCGGGAGTYYYVRSERAKQAERAVALDNEVTALLNGGKIADLTIAEQKLSQSFDLDANSPVTARLWVRDRVLRGLETEGDSPGIDTAMGRAKQVGLSDSELIFARVGSFLAQGDVAGAAAVLPVGDAQASKDPFYQLVAGATLERAGDARAVERFQLAANLGPDILAAQVMLARAVTLEGSAARGTEMARALRAKWPDRPEGAALVALAWARTPDRGSAPPEVQEARTRREELPVSLALVPPAIDALQAIERHDGAQARAALDKAIRLANSPSVAAWLGTLALEMDDEATARQAALAAVQFSAIYPPARVLAARVALLGGRLDEAQNALNELDATVPQVAAAKAALAYERADIDGLSLALDAVGVDARATADFAALTKAADILRATAAAPDAAKLQKLVHPETTWGEFIMVDAALDQGNLELAKLIIDSWHDAKERPPRALRLSRLLRYQDKAAEADVPSKNALEGDAPTTRTLLERTLVLVATGRGEEARPLLSKYAAVLGPMAAWALAYVDATGPRAADARGRVALLDPPPDGAPLVLRTIAALALGELKDVRHLALAIRTLPKTVQRNPDILHAADAAKGIKTAATAAAPKKR